MWKNIRLNYYIVKKFLDVTNGMYKNFAVLKLVLKYSKGIPCDREAVEDILIYHLRNVPDFDTLVDIFNFKITV